MKKPQSLSTSAPKPLSLCGIDEAGRGPLAGPLVFAGVILTKEIKGLNDSKVLSEKKRESLFDEILENSHHKIVFSSSQEIDEYGLSYCIKNSLRIITESLEASQYIFDGNSSYGFSMIEHMTKADAKVPSVSAASILAKVSRDRYMCEIAKLYPQYLFDKHKGYGTKEHTDLMEQYGLSPIHRVSFKLKKKVVEKSLFD